jgi:hypothetical protein
VNLLEARVALRPRSMSDVLDLAGPFCMGNRRLMGRLALLLVTGGAGLGALCRLKLEWSWSSVWLLVAAYLLLTNGIYTLAAGELLFRRPDEIRVRALLTRFARRFPSYAVARILHLIELTICATIVVPLPIFAARWFFFGEALLLESAAPLASLGRSSRLVLFRSGPCLGLALASLCAPFLFAAAADVIGNAIVHLLLQMGQPLGSLFDNGGSGFAVVGALLSAPFVASASFLGYIDMRTRKEGWDIQLRFMALADDDAKERKERKERTIAS